MEKCFVLSGGGCRGFAHLGVVKALQEFGISPSEIAGTSAGAIAGVFLADGFTPDEIKEMFLSQLKLSMFPLNWFKPGLVSMKNIREFLENNLRHTQFDELQIPFYVTATNFIDGRQTIFKEGELINAVIAASSIPVLFTPVTIDHIPYVDGGLSNNLPVEPFSNRKQEVVGVYVNPIKPFNPGESSMEILDRSIHLSFREVVRLSAEGCYLLIEPEGLENFGLFDIHKLPEIFDVGYNSTKVILLNFKI
ncbi:MAG TPA: patatin-like phospholipase family protein [Bacteroidia bacterium]|nr:patatin-like phospholipase family protein [Bacteroidia bacterium]